MSDSEAENAVVREKEEMTLERILIHALSNSKEFQE